MNRSLLILRATGMCASVAMMAGALVLGAADQAPPAAAAPQKPAPPPADAGPPPTGAKLVLEGGDADDRLAGTDANEWFLAGKGNDIVIGGRGRDAIDGGDGDDTVDAGPDNDVVDGAAGSDTLRGGDGNDVIEGGDDDDLIDGGGGNDNADGGDGNDVLRGAAGDDWLAGGDGVDSVSGGAGNDRLFGNDGVDALAGEAGNDTLTGGDGDDTLAGDAGDDILDGGQGDDVLRGGAGNDMLLGSTGGDTLDGGPDHDFVFGGDGRDTVNGSAGSDWLAGGPNADFVNGGDGDDLIVLRAGDVRTNEVEVVDGGGGSDLLILNGFALRHSAATSPVLTDPLTAGSYRFISVERVEHTYVVPHLSLDASRVTSLIVINPTTEPVRGRIGFFGADGAPLTAPIRSGASPDGSFEVPAAGTATIEAVSSAGATAGGAQLFANGPIGVLVRTASPALGPITAGDEPLLDSVMLPLAENRTTTAGAIVMNSVFRSRLKLTVRSADGREDLQASAVEFDLEPYAQRTVFVRELFPTLGDFVGTLTIEGGIDRPQEGGPIVVTPLLRRGDAVVVGTAATRVAPLPTPAPLTFPKVTSGGEAPSTILLVNPSVAAPARGTLSFFDAEGRPWPIAVNGGPPAAAVPFEIAPGGSATFSAGTGGVAQVGSARAVAGDGQVGGVLRAAATQRIADAPPSSVSTAFTAWARRDRASGVTTELTVTSTERAAALELVLRDRAGMAVAGGTAKLSVAANGQVVRALDVLFPNAATDTFDGSVTATSDVAVAVTLTHVESGAAVAVPVTPFR